MIAHVGPTGRSLEAFGGSFAPSCEDFVLGRAGNIPHFGAMWASTWAGVAPKKVQLLGAKLRHVGLKLGPSLSQVGQVEALLAKVGPKLSPCCGHVGLTW